MDKRKSKKYKPSSKAEYKKLELFLWLKIIISETSIQNMVFQFPRWLVLRKGEPLDQVFNVSISLSMF